jgi:GxxExxY protein
MNTEYKHQDLTEKIINIFYRVYNKLGYGFLEKVYEKAFLIELQKDNIRGYPQFPIKVYYDDMVIGEYWADIVIEEKVIVELKARKSLIEDDEAQLLNYLKATKIEVGLLFNFGPKPQLKRKAFDNDRK